jgi:glycosyltransferase involved in cell wall biosynthesis
MKKISVILAVHNGQEYIQETLTSLLSQTYKEFEIIIVLNCSSDATKEIIQKLDDARIFLYETSVCQLAFNLNYGLNKASGEYIVRIDADDIADPKRLEKQLETIEKYGYDVVGTNITYIDENTQPIGEKIYPEHNKAIRKAIFYTCPLAHPSVMYKKEVIMGVGGYMNGKVSEDYDLWLRLMRNPEVVFYNMQEPLTHYRIHANQAKGNTYAYAEIAGYMLRETLFRKSLRCFIGIFIYIFKMIVK